MSKLSVVIPVYNEARTIREIVARVRAVPARQGADHRRRLLDRRHPGGRCADLARATDVVVVRHERNRGKGAALQDRLRRRHAATSSSSRTPTSSTIPRSTRS